MFKREPRPTLTVGPRWADGYEVTFPVSYSYNGGIVINNRLYKGFRVPKPKVPKGYELKPIYCSLQLNARPPYATNYIVRKDGKPIKKTELKAAIAEQSRSSKS